MTMIDKGIEGLRRALGEMATSAQDMLDLAIEAIETGSGEKRDAVLEADTRLNQFELRLDHMCETLLALQEPYAVDFRFIFSAIKSTRDLERMGDESKLIARWSARRGTAGSHQLLELAKAVREEVGDAIVAFRTQDVDRARRVVRADRKVDDLEAHILQETESVPEAFIAHALERIGDRSVNLAENVIYVVEAEDVRHLKDTKRSD